MGPVRSWIIRALIMTVLAGLAAVGYVMHDWVSPERVKEAVLASLREQFPQCQVHIGSARLRLFGGICVTDWTLTREGESEPFFSAESAVIAHDKEQLNHGRVVLRKIELEEPVFQVQRRADGTWNLAEVFQGGPSDQPLPTVTIRNATIHLSDAQPNGLPPITILASKLNLLNDPLPELKIELQAILAPKAGALSIPFHAIVKRYRSNGETQIRLDVPNINLTPELAPALGKLSPMLEEHLSELTAQLSLKAELTLNPGEPLKYEVKLEVKDGRLDDPNLPMPVEHLAALVQIRDGKVFVEKGTAKLGRANAEFSFETRDPTPASSPDSDAPAILPVSVAPAPEPADPIEQLESKLDRLELTLRGLTLDDEFFDRLPASAREDANSIRKLFNPVGSIDVTSKFSRTGPNWRRDIEVFPNRLTITYRDFNYPIQDVGGWVKKVMTGQGDDEYRVQLTGSASGRRVELSGRVQGEGPDPLIDLKIAGTDIPIDQKLFNALPEKHAKVLNKLQANARGDFIVEVKQPFGVNRIENTFRVRLYDGSFNYVHFPYLLTKVKGHVLIRVSSSVPDRPLKPGLPLEPVPNQNRVELREFEATHGDARIWLSGDFEPIPDTADHRFSLRLQGEGVPLDDDLRLALQEMKVEDLWTTLQPRGKLTFGADLELIDHGHETSVPLPSESPGIVLPVVAALPGDPDFNPINDLKLAVNFKGPTVTPSFFPYELQDLAGVLRFAGGKLDLARFSGRHGESRMTLDAGEIILGSGGDVWANLGGLALRPFIPDPVLIEALPGKLRAAASLLQLRGPMEFYVRHLVLKVPRPAERAVSRGQEPQILPLPPILGQPLPLPPPAPPLEPVIYWNTELKLSGAHFVAGLNYEDVHGLIASTGRYEGNTLGAVMGTIWLDRVNVNKIPVHSSKLTFRIRPQQPQPEPGTGYQPPVVEFPEITALLFKGSITGEARLELSDPVRYRVMLNAANVRLEDVATHYKLSEQAELRGLAQGQFYFENRLDNRSGKMIPCGTGQIDVPNGRMLNLPVLLPLLKLLKLQAPDQTAFEAAHAVFDLKGDRVTVSQLDLIGTAVSLGGWGELDTRGEEMHFEFYTVWSQALKRWLSTPFGDVTSFLSGNLFKIEMVRKQGEMHYKPVMLPVITEPVRNVAERLRNRFSR